MVNFIRAARGLAAHLMPPIFWTLWTDHRFRVGIISLWAMCAVICTCHIAATLVDFSRPEAKGALEFWKLSTELGVAQIFEGVLLAIASVALWSAAAKRRAPILRSIALLLLWINIDNVGGVHELVGRWSIEHLNVGKTAGELLGFLLFLAPLALVAWKGRGQPVSTMFIRLIALLGAFAVVIDAAHQALKFDGLFGRLVRGAAVLLEDGGEMLVIALICACALAVAGAFSPRAPRKDVAGVPVPAE